MPFVRCIAANEDLLWELKALYSLYSKLDSKMEKQNMHGLDMVINN